MGETNPPAVPRQGRAIAGAIAREPPSLQTGRALTGAVRRIKRSPRGGRPKSRLTAAFGSMGERVRRPRPLRRRGAPLKSPLKLRGLLAPRFPVACFRPA